MGTDPPGMPEPLSKSAQTMCFVDSHHAGNVVTSISHTSVLIYVINAPIIWFSNNKNTDNISTFESELVMMRITRDLLVRLHYRLSIFGVPSDGPSDVMHDNQIVVNNTILTQSTLGKKQNAVNYHVVCETSAEGILWEGRDYIDTKLADLLKTILGWKRHHKIPPLFVHSR